MSGLTAVSLFAGVGGFDEAMRRAGVRVAASVEIDPACRGVLRRHFPETKVFNDVTEVTGDQLRAAGLVPGHGIIAGGWPCQGNSVAGRGNGMADPRSGLWRHLVRLLAEARPRWFIGENVPGLLSVNGGRDFGTVIRDLDDLGYGVAWRVLDAQWFGVPQRRRRVFVVGCLGDAAGPVEVLLEPEGGERHSPEGRETGPCSARASSGGVVSTLQGGGRRGHRVDAEGAAGGHLIAATLTAGIATGAGVRPAGRRAEDDINLIAFDAAQITSGENRANPKPGDPGPRLAVTGQPMIAGTLRSQPRPGSNSSGAIISGMPMAFNPQSGGSKARIGYGETPTALQASQVTAVHEACAVRRLTPVECERLQGFPDDWTRWLDDGTEQSDSARYRECGNAVALPVVEWIARRVVAVDEARAARSAA